MSGVGTALKNSFKNTALKTTKSLLSLNPKDHAKGVEDIFNPKNHLNDLEKSLDEIGAGFSPQAPEINIDSGDQTIAPMPDSEELRKARRRNGATSRAGRASTILSEASTRLGG